MLTKKQVELYMKYRHEGKTQKIAAIKCNVSERSGRAIDQRTHPYFHPKKRKKWRTRHDPFKEVWDQELVPLLNKHPDIQAKTLLEHLQQTMPGTYPDNLLRTMQRRVQHWKALYGRGKEVIFRQNHYPAEQGISDFTHADQLGVTIQGEKLKHRFYHFRLTFSGWSYAQVVQGGESFCALSEGLQNALTLLGGSPRTHRTDSLSAAYKNLGGKQEEDFTRLYQELCDHYEMKATRNNKGVSHENGSIESSNRHFKAQVKQMLFLRGSHDFKSLEEYQAFIDEILEKKNARNQKLIQEEIKMLNPLPRNRSQDYEEHSMRVTCHSTINVKNIIYSVPSRLVGLRIKVHLYENQLEAYLGTTKILSLKRERIEKGQPRRKIDYKHIASALSKKPGAFRNYIYKDDLFPNEVFKETWQYLDTHLNDRQACREYVTLLKLAARNEDGVTFLLKNMLIKNNPIQSKGIEEKLGKTKSETREINIPCSSLKEYNQLIGGVNGFNS